MESMAAWQGKALDENYWQRSLEEDHWAALLEQGEIPPSTDPAADDQRAAKPAAEPLADGPAPTEDNAPNDGNSWSAAQAAMQKGELFSLAISGANRGGLLVEWNGLPGFVPASHLKIVLRNMDQHERMSELASPVMLTRVARSPSAPVTRIEPALVRCASAPGWSDCVVKPLSIVQAS